MTGVLFIVTVPKCVPDKNNGKSCASTSDKIKSSQSSVRACNSESNLASTSGGGGEKGTNKIVSKIFIENESGVTGKCGSIPQIRVDGDANSLILPTEEASDETPTDEILREILKKLNVSDAAWCSQAGADSHCSDSHWQVSFSVAGRARSERTLRTLRAAGLGTTRRGTTVCVVPCSLHYRSPVASVHFSSNERGERPPDAEATANNKQTAWGAFVESVRARQTVAQVVEQIKSQTELTFDFLFLLVVAAFVAAIGLIEESTVFLVASMLISPLMGPIMASTFGTAIRDKELLKLGVMHELFGLFLSLIIGFIFGLIICSFNECPVEAGWPTNEIKTRSLWVGALIAIPSGAAVAIAVLSDNTASLVGVAISASLLPPAVNAGLLWAMSLTHLVFDRNFENLKNSTIANIPDNPVVDYAVDGFISLCLTLVNIICIYIAGILVYMIKEVAPVNSTDDQFWKHGIKAVRDFNKALPEEKTSRVTEEVVKENSSDDSDEEAFSNIYNLDLKRQLYGQFSYPKNSHSTWSPQVLSRRVSAKEIRGLYRQFSEDPKSRIHRLSFPSNQLPGYKRIIDDGDCSLSSNEWIPGKKPKFTVTPVEDHQMNDS